MTQASGTASGTATALLVTNTLVLKSTALTEIAPLLALVGSVYVSRVAGTGHPSVFLAIPNRRVRMSFSRLFVLKRKSIVTVHSWNLREPLPYTS